MALKPTIVSPGVELFEYDDSVRASIPAGTTVFIPGFAPQGPTEEVSYVSSIEDFEQTFGYPTNPAERYFYRTVANVLASSATVAVSRLPYGKGEGDIKSPQYTVLGYPALGYAIAESDGAVSYAKLTKFTEGSTVADILDEETGNIKTYVKGSATFLVGEPVQFNISLEQYYAFLNGQALTATGVDTTKEFGWSETITEDFSSVDVSGLGKFAFLALNIAKTVTNDEYEGFYIGLSDNAFSDPGHESTEGYGAITKLKTLTTLSDDGSGLTGADYVSIPAERLDFKLSSTSKGCVSQIMQESINSFDISGAQWNDTLNVGIFKIRQSTGNGDALKLAAIINNGYNASFEAGRKTTSKYTSTAVDFFIENVSKNDGPLNFYVNPYLSGALTARGLNTDGTPKIKIRVLANQLASIAPSTTDATVESLMAAAAGIDKATVDGLLADSAKVKAADALYPIGLYAKADNASKLIGNVPGKVSNALRLIANEEIYNIDLVLEAGLGTIYVGAKDVETNEDGTGSIFDDTKLIKGVTDLRTGKSTISADAQTVIDNFRSVQNAFLSIACSQQDGGRGDLLFIGDSIRHIAVEGKSNKIETQFGMPLVNSQYTEADNVKQSFSTSIYWPLRHLFDGVATSYMMVAPHWLKYADLNTGTQYWAPSSGAIAAAMAATDAKFGPWQAAAGATNGVIPNTLDISFDTNQRQRDDLYKISLNSIVASPRSGTMIYGIRTFIKKDSVFDQVTCRRTFLYLAKILRDTARSFLFEGNTDYTRLMVTNTLDPVFQSLVNQRALYSYVLICDSRNNTEQVIDEGNMEIAAYASPVRTAERILIGVHATRSGIIVTEYDQ